MSTSEPPGAELRSTRRTVVRAAAWSTPAVVVAATAPPASAASGLLSLEVQDGATSVSADGESLVFSGFTVTPSGGSIAAGELAVTVGFVPTAPSTSRFLNSAHETIGGWACPLATKATEVQIVFGGTVADGQPTGALEGQRVYLFLPVNQQPGSFVVSVSAPAAGFTTPVVRTFPVPPPTLSLHLGQTYTEPVGTDQRCELVFDGLGIGMSGGVLTSGLLTLTVSFDPAAPSTRTALDPLNKDADPWDYDRDDSNVQEVVFTYEHDLLTIDQTADFPFGPYLATQFPAGDQPGSFVLTASAPGYTSATTKIKADLNGRLVYDSGASYVAPGIGGGWQVTFEDARVTPSGLHDVPLGPLTMVASFEPTGSVTDWIGSSVPPEGLPDSGWVVPAHGLAGPSLTYYTRDPLTEGNPMAIPDGGLFHSETDPGDRGTFKLDFSAWGQQPTSHTYVVPPPYLTATFDPRTNRVMESDGHWYTWMGDSVLRVQGGSLPANALAMTVTFEPTAPDGDSSLNFYPIRFPGWSQPYTQIPSTQALSGQYVYQSAVADGDLLTFTTRGFSFSTVEHGPGTFVFRFSSLIVTTPAFRPVEVRTPAPS